MKKFSLVLLLAILSGCTSQLYVARTSFVDGDQECMAQAYWYKTDYLIGDKADRVLTVTSGGKRRSVEYVEDQGRIVYFGDETRDTKVYGNAPESETFICGWIEDLAELKQFRGDELRLYMHCKAKLSPLSLVKGYLPARETAYIFTVSKEELTSLSGKLPSPPPPPTCTPLQ